MPVVNANQLLLDYVDFCERRGQLLGLSEYAVVWKVANEIAEETAPEDREMVLASILPDVE
jgi:hypothetical protein